MRTDTTGQTVRGANPGKRARFRAIVQATPECVKLVSRDGTLLKINSAGLAMVEADRAEDIIGCSVYSIIAPEHRDAYREFHEQVCRGESRRLEFDIIGLRGSAGRWRDMPFHWWTPAERYSTWQSRGT